MEDRGNSTVTSDTRSSIDHLAVRMLTVNAWCFRDELLAARP